MSGCDSFRVVVVLGLSRCRSRSRQARLSRSMSACHRGSSASNGPKSVSSRRQSIGRMTAWESRLPRSSAPSRACGSLGWVLHGSDSRSPRVRSDQKGFHPPRDPLLIWLFLLPARPRLLRAFVSSRSRHRVRRCRRLWLRGRLHPSLKQGTRFVSCHRQVGSQCARVTGRSHQGYGRATSLSRWSLEWKGSRTPSMPRTQQDLRLPSRSRSSWPTIARSTGSELPSC